MSSTTLDHLSYGGFQMALAGYVVALVCLAIEFASHRGVEPAAAGSAAAAVGARAGARGGTLVLDKPGPSAAAGGIGHIAAVERPRVPMAQRFGRSGLLVLGVGFLGHVASIVLRGLAAGRVPWANLYEIISLVCAVAVGGFLLLLRRGQDRAVGFFVLIPVVVLMYVAGTVLYLSATAVVPALHSYWLVVHVLAVSLSSGMLLLAGAASVMYLLRARYERKHTAELAWASEHLIDVTADQRDRALLTERSRLARLPSLATLDRLAYRTTIVAFPIFTFAVIAGAMWAEVAWGRYWGWDPKETCAFITWVFYAAYLHARSTGGWRGVRSAWISVVGFVSVLFNLFVINFVATGLHEYTGLKS